ncbi:hypothetical protein C943_00394 [Mariniradius saccharolyticus AK6]|uniref:Uncharacterized protein n=1 Tax=Mariniradius saccharolyticus AK6 TaxID=1239962 RepID=M7XX81_9BACT|nr:hypothetical protein C943_00394 [Mariniradius saccharolyticus AK6]
MGLQIQFLNKLFDSLHGLQFFPNVSNFRQQGSGSLRASTVDNLCFWSVLVWENCGEIMVKNIAKQSFTQ